MNKLVSSIKLSVPDKIFLKDTEFSDQGKRILESRILLMNEIGFGNFTFKKLGLKIGPNESSIYRYFEGKNKLLVYLSARYWAWIAYQLVFEIHNISDPEEKQRKAIQIFSKNVEKDLSFSHVNDILSHNIIANENSKSYLRKEVDNENKQGYFAVHKRLIARLKDIILSVSPKYHYPTRLASTIMEGRLHQQFLKVHFKSMTDCNKSDSPTHFLTDFTFYTLKNYQNV